MLVSGIGNSFVSAFSRYDLTAESLLFEFAALPSTPLIHYIQQTSFAKGEAGLCLGSWLLAKTSSLRRTSKDFPPSNTAPPIKPATPRMDSRNPFRAIFADLREKQKLQEEKLRREAEERANAKTMASQVPLLERIRNNPMFRVKSKPVFTQGSKDTVPFVVESSKSVTPVPANDEPKEREVIPITRDSISTTAVPNEDTTLILSSEVDLLLDPWRVQPSDTLLDTSVLPIASGSVSAAVPYKDPYEQLSEDEDYDETCLPEERAEEERKARARKEMKALTKSLRSEWRKEEIRDMNRYKRWARQERLMNRGSMKMGETIRRWGRRMDEEHGHQNVCSRRRRLSSTIGTRVLPEYVLYAVWVCVFTNKCGLVDLCWVGRRRRRMEAKEAKTGKPLHHS